MSRKKGFHHSEETKKKMSKSLKGRTISLEQREKVRKKLKGTKRPPFSKEWKNNMKLAHVNNEKWKKSISSLANRKKISKAMMGHKCFHKPRIKYKKHFFRSSWEVITAKYLDSRKIKWLYEPKRFYYKNFSYLPDFYLPQDDIRIEVKGWMTSHDYKKIIEFKKDNHRLLLIQQNEINIIKQIFKEG